MHPRKSMANSAPTFVGGQQIGGPPPNLPGGASQFGRPTVGDQGLGNDDNRSFFDKERERLIEDIAGGFEELLSSANVLNRKLEEVFGVGKEFQTVANLWGQFNTLIREQKDDPAAESTIPPSSVGRTGPQGSNQLRISQGIPGTGGATFGQPPAQ